MRGLSTILLLLCSNIFMTFAWYGHLKWGKPAADAVANTGKAASPTPLVLLILLSWGIAFFEYCCQVPANRLGFKGNGGPFTLYQLKIIQEAITLLVFVVFSALLFKENLRWNHALALVLVFAAVALVFKK
ncbi:MAG: DMT family protein [Bacteroidales bacterium]|nr:DMT family protein [Bacteroidales bacterium]